MSDSFASRFIDALRGIERDGASAVEPMVDLYADAAELTNPVLQRAGHRRNGRDGARAFWSEYAALFTGACTEFTRVVNEERTAALFWTTRHSDGGSYDGATLIELDESQRIVRFRGYFDPAELARR